MNRKSEVIFFDDFTGKELDRKRWNVEVTGPVYNQEQQAYVDSRETIYLIPGADQGANPKINTGSKTILIIIPEVSPFIPSFTFPQSLN